MKSRSQLRVGDKVGFVVCVRRIPGFCPPKAEFKCMCGRTFVSRVQPLVLGRTKSCGCYRDVKATADNTTHGESGAKSHKETAEHRTWRMMLGRCRNPRVANYKYYGGRGISVCPRWLKYENFLSDMGRRPPNRSIDRINVDGDYGPTNCRWATAIEQANNKRPYARPT